MDRQPLVAGVIGWPVQHSRSPDIYHAAAKHLGLDLTFGRFPVVPGDARAALDAVRSLHLRGLSVTTPHKADVCALVDERTNVAERLGAVNCVVNNDGTLLGLNTDGEGFLIGLQHELDFTLAGRSVVVVGAGGAARAIGLACSEAGAGSIGILNRSRERAESAVSAIGGSALVVSNDAIGDADLVVNATTVGMAGTSGEGEMPFDPECTLSAACIADIVYNPIETPLLQAARHHGRRTSGGLAMLAGQAAAQFTAWTGAAAPLDVMLSAVV